MSAPPIDETARLMETYGPVRVFRFRDDDGHAAYVATCAVCQAGHVERAGGEGFRKSKVWAFDHRAAHCPARKSRRLRVIA